MEKKKKNTYNNKIKKLRRGQKSEGVRNDFWRRVWRFFIGRKREVTSLILSKLQLKWESDSLPMCRLEDPIVPGLGAL